MTRLNRQAIQAHRTLLTNWQAPAEFEAHVKRLHSEIGDDLFIQSGLEFARDAWSAGRYAILSSSELVRLVPQSEEWPDFEVRQSKNGVIEQFEVAEADVPGRRRGDEYRLYKRKAALGESLLEHDPVDDWIARASKVPEALQAICERKIKKRYVSMVNLLIYLNIGEYGIRQNQIEKSFHTSTEKANSSFCNVWILWKDRLYLVWDHERPNYF